MTAPFSVASPTPDVAAATQVKVAGNQLFQMMLRSYQGSYNLVWTNPNATPDKIVTAMGTDAVKLFTLERGPGSAFDQRRRYGHPPDHAGRVDVHGK